uniref:Uncharacterized protein n=1 Tax=Nelumbo nucifera TaxID=4432 RepID=A0A822YXE8_NELNU|nr:TPA_asm: hypothetical protein HUJ06_006485 [Nelumbo nucifera]
MCDSIEGHRCVSSWISDNSLAPSQFIGLLFFPGKIRCRPVGGEGRGLVLVLIGSSGLA